MFLGKSLLLNLFLTTFCPVQVHQCWMRDRMPKTMDKYCSNMDLVYRTSIRCRYLVLIQRYIDLHQASSGEEWKAIGKRILLLFGIKRAFVSGAVRESLSVPVSFTFYLSSSSKDLPYYNLPGIIDWRGMESSASATDSIVFWHRKGIRTKNWSSISVIGLNCAVLQ